MSVVTSTPNQNPQVTSSAIIQRMEAHYRQWEHDTAKEHPHSYQKDVLGDRADPKVCSHPKTGFLNLGTIDILGWIMGVLGETSYTL